MALITNSWLEDDLDGKPAEETVQFGLDGRQYVIDLSSDNAHTLRELLSVYVQAGRVDKPSPLLRRARPDRSYDPVAVREWARQQGMTVGERGRIHKDIVDAYQRETSA